jgi:lipoprotein-releasing system permease protein
MIGMAVGSFAMIVSLAVMNGFESRVSDRLRGFDGDIRILGKIDSKIVEQIQSLNNVQSVMPFIERKGIISSQDGQEVIVYKAMDLEKMHDVYDIYFEKELEAGSGIFVGKALAYRMGFSLGDPVELMSPLDMSFTLGLPPKIKKEITGTFQSQVLDYDEQIVFIPIEIGQKLFKRIKGYTGIDIRAKSGQDIERLSKSISNVIGENFRVLTWKEQHSTLVQAMALERFLAIIILSLIIVVAGFNLASTLSLVTIQKIHEIGILQAIGTPKKALRDILIRQGFILGGKGTLFGILAGIILVGIQRKMGIIPLPSDIYFIDKLPMELSLWNLLVIPIISFGIIYIASFIASRKASEIDPKTALTWNK